MIDHPKNAKLLMSSYPLNQPFVIEEHKIEITRKNFSCQLIHSECSNLPKQIQKFYKKRFFLFKKFSEGIVLDEESWYSVIPEDMSAHISEKLVQFSKESRIVDGFCGSGGLAIQIAQRFKSLTCIDIDPIKIKNIKNNLLVYGQAAEVLCMSFFDYIPAAAEDTILIMCPPWGGINYQLKQFNLQTMKPSLQELLEKGFQVSQKLVLQLPKNIDLKQLIEIFSLVEDKLRLTKKNIEVEQLLINEAVNQLIIYYGF